MKKAVSLFLALIIALSVSVTALASSGDCECGTLPVVFVHGFGSYAMYIDPESDSPESVFPPATDKILKSVPDILKVVNTLFITKNYEKCADALIDVVKELLGGIAFDGNGDPINNIGLLPNELPTVDKHKGHNYDFDTHAENHADCDQYDFYYNYLLDPMLNAEYLNDYITCVKELTNHKKVDLVCHSQGNTIVAAYLQKYGAGSVNKTVFLSPAYLGLSMVGNLFNENIQLAGKGDAFTLYFSGLLGKDPAGQLASAIISSLNDACVLPYLLYTFQKLVDAQFNRVFDEALIEVFGTSPAVWSFCPDEYYESAKANMFPDTEKYAGLIAKIDDYHYNVQCKLTDILDSAERQGMSFAICAGYNIPTIPISGEEEGQSDMLIDTKYMSIGATGAKPGKIFGEDYEQKNYAGGINYISPDRIIDASTCAYPDRTWFFKDQGHDKFPAGYIAFITDLLAHEGQPTVSDMTDYVQFMTTDSDENIVFIKGPEEKDTRYNIEIIFDSLGQMIAGAFTK